MNTRFWALWFGSGLLAATPVAVQAQAATAAPAVAPSAVPPVAPITTPTPPPPLAAGAIVTLAALEEQALSLRPTLDAQRARMHRAAAEVERRRAAYNPNLVLGADASLAPGGSLQVIPNSGGVLVQGSRPLADGSSAFAPQARYGTTLGLSMSLYDFGRTALSVEAARAEQSAANADDAAVRRQVLGDVRGAYLGWLATTELSELSAQAVSDAHARHDRVMALVSEGVKPSADVSPVASEEMLARLDAARTRNDLANARLVLEAAVGGPLPHDALPDRSVLAADTLPASADSSSDANAAVNALDLQRDAARATARMYDHVHAPVIGAEAQAGLRGQSPLGASGTNGIFPMYRVGVSVSVPLWDGGGASASADVARAQAEELSARSRELAAARQTARSQAQQEQESAAERLGIARELLALSETRVREAEERYEQGAGRIEAIAEANLMLRRARSEIVLAEIAGQRARFVAQGQ